MSAIQSWTRRHISTLLLALIAGGFAVILGELILYKHYEGMQLVGFVSTLVALIIAIWGIFARGGLRITFAVVMLLLSVTGVIGVLEHSESENEGGARRPTTAVAANLEIANRAPVVSQDNDEAPASPQGARPPGGFRMPPPPLAPLGLSGLALMGAVVLLAKKDEPATANAG